jgi:hypothetical protein
VRNAIISLMQDLYFDEGSARAVLIGIGYRAAQIPQFRAADTFWPDVVLRLERGIVPDGIRKLLAVAVRDHPGSEAAQALLTEAGGAAGPVELGGAAGPVTVLCLLTDPLRESKIRIDHEARLLQEIQDLGGIQIRTRHAVRVTDIIQAILHEKPQILHFAGHGRQNGQLVFEDDGGAPADVGPEELAQAIAAATTGVLDCVVLNSCFTGGNAQSFRGATRAVAGSVTSIGDDCAIAFARGFYTGIRTGHTAEQAYEIACAEMKLGRCDTSGLHFVSFPAAT